MLCQYKKILGYIIIYKDAIYFSTDGTIEFFGSEKNHYQTYFEELKFYYEGLSIFDLFLGQPKGANNLKTSEPVWPHPMIPTVLPES